MKQELITEVGVVVGGYYEKNDEGGEGRMEKDSATVQSELERKRGSRVDPPDRYGGEGKKAPYQVKVSRGVEKS